MNALAERTSLWANAISEKELRCSEFELACVNGRFYFFPIGIMI